MNEATLRNRTYYFTISGFLLGITAPIAWTFIRLVLFWDPSAPLFSQIFSDISRNSYQMALYAYMGLGTAGVMAALGFIIGRANSELHDRAVELDTLHREVAEQKEVFENRYKVLDNNIKNFHHISSKIQKSTDIGEVLYLCSEGLHEVLGYERVNILMVDDEKKALRFVTSTGTAGDDLPTQTLPLDHRSGVLYKCVTEKRLYLIDDIVKYPADYHLQPPYNSIKPLRSRSFVVCPIIVRGETVGIFGIDNKFSHRSLNDTDVDTIKLFADQASFAIIQINLLQAIGTLTSEMDKIFRTLLNDRDRFGRNVRNLEVAVDDVANATRNIVSASDSVMSSVDSTSSAAVEISASMDQMARNLEFLAENVEKSASAMEEINQSIKLVEQNTGLSHERSSDTKLQADRGVSVVHETIAALAELQKSVDVTFDAIRRLGDNSGRIDGIINVINAITKKTNLLALNASIIAAQAGEYGKSFAVVADEIRDLSLQTGQSTGEITDIINEIVDETQRAGRNVAVTKDLAARGVDLGRMMEDSLRIIQQSSEESMNMTREIKSATTEQAKSVQFVTHSIEDVSSMTQQMSNASTEQSQGIKNIVRAIESIKTLSHEMVGATARQADAGTQIRRNFEAVSQLVSELFDELQKRQAQSEDVVRELETIRSRR